MSKTNSKSTFILLKILDKDAVNFINALKEIFKDKTSGIYPHVTLRGPYENGVPKEDIEYVKKIFSDRNVLTINGAGMFNNHDNYVVYLKVSRKNIEKAIYKKDYPISKYGINPHITIYKGRNCSKAERILSFINSKEKLCIKCTKSDVVLYQKSESSEKCTNPSESIPKIMKALEGKNNELFTILQEAQELSKENFKGVTFAGNELR